MAAFQERCQVREVRPHLYRTKSMVEDLREDMDEPCIEAPKQPRRTRAEVIHALVAAQDGPQQGVHHLKLDRAYPSWLGQRRRLSLASSESLATVVRCHRANDPTHTMARRGNAVECASCLARSKIQEEKATLTSRLRSTCSHSRSKDLRQMFK